MFPLCYGYWRKYVDHKMRLCTVEKVVEVFERSVLSVTYCVDMWVDYCNFGRLVFEDQSDVRRLFKRAISFVGKDYLCHTLWDKYIEFEFSLKHWSSLAHIYIQALRFPTKKLHRYYDNFKKLVGIWEGAMKSHSNSMVTVPAEPMLNNGTSIRYSQDDLSCIIKDILDPSSGLDRLKALNKYRSLGEGLFQEAVQLYEKVNFFETRIKRSYFHVKPLDISQLHNWHDYLDFAESHGDFNWAVQLYERCLIPCANYPEFWMRYVEFMDRKGGREIANFALDRATQIHLKRLSVIHLFNARFKEHIGDIFNARAAFLQCSTASDKDFVENVVMRANMEKRLGNSVAASTIYKDALETATAKEKWHILPVLYIHFSRLKYNVTDCEDASIDILTDGIKHVPSCKLLIEELIKFAIMHRGSRHINVIDSIVANAICPQPGGSQALSPEDGEEISRLYLEFVDLCGTVCDVRKAWNRHIRLFSLSVRDALFHPAVEARQWKMAVEAREETLLSLPNQPPGDCNSDCLMQASLQHQKLPSSENNDTHQAADPEVLEQKSPLLANHDNMLSSQLSDQESPLVENLDELPEKAKTDLLQSGESDNSHEEDVYQVAVKVSNAVEENVIKPKPSPDLEHEIANETENTPASLQFKKENDVQTEYNYKLEEDLKLPSLETLSLDTQQDAKFAVPMSPPPCDSEAPEGTSLSDGNLLKSEASQKNSISNENILECGLNAKACDSISSPVSAQATVCQRTNIRNDCASSSVNTQNITGQQLPRPPKQAAGRNWHQRNNSDRFRRDSKFESRGHSHKRLHKQRQSSPQRTRQRAEKHSSTPVNKDYLSHGRSSQNPHRQDGPVQNSYPPLNVHSNEVPSQDWLMHSSQQNLSAAYQSQQPTQPAVYLQPQIPQYSLQNSEPQGNVQNKQACNETWQYYYYQQQQQQFFWQQQQLLQHQQPQQQQLSQHQYQQQLLQMQYFQQQGQQPQISYQQQQLQQLQQQQEGHLQQQQLLQQQQQQLQQLQQQQEGHLQQQPKLLQQQQLQQQEGHLQQQPKLLQQQLLQQQQLHMLYLQQQQQLQLQPQYQQSQLQLQQQIASTQQYPHGQEQGQSKQQTDTSQIQDGDTPLHNSGEQRTNESSASPHPVSPSPSCG
ncbi:pre-mRNA-processing factor 39-2 isoform X2 [Euphorbia lathyris]